LLHLAKGETVPITITRVDLTPIVEQVFKHWAFAAEQKNLRLSYLESEERCALADKQKMGFIIDNLIGNAVKYNRDGGTIHVWHEEKKGILSTFIEDTGYGIDEENLKKIFKPYFREMKDASIPGTGLGLYSAKKFIEQMHGTIDVVPMKKGTRFILELPTRAK
jgi:signal transduction histidine kinase